MGGSCLKQPADQGRECTQTPTKEKVQRSTPERVDNSAQAIPTIVTRNRFSPLEEHLSTPKQTDRTRIEVTFKGPDNVLSNFYPCRLEYEGQHYSSAEHVYRTSHALFLHQLSAAQEIRWARHAGEAKLIARKRLTSTKEWNEAKTHIMRKIMITKAKQVPAFLKALKDTGTRPLTHNVPDEYWGTGISGTGQNVMGKILEEIRGDETLTATMTHQHMVIAEKAEKQASVTTSILLIGNSNVKVILDSYG